MHGNHELSGLISRRSSRRAFLKWSALAVIGTGLAGCAPKIVKETVVVEKEKEITKVIEKAVTATPAPEGPITLRFPHAMGDEGQPVFQKTADAFKQAHPNVTVKVEPTFDWDAQKYLVQAAAGTAPDIMWGDEHYVYEFAPKGILLDEGPLMDAAQFKKEDFDDIFWFYEYLGKQYGIPLWFGCYCIYYNKKILSDAGVPFPTPDWTYDDMLTILKKVTKTDTKPEIWGIRAQTHWNRWGSLIWAFGGVFFNADGTKFILCDKPNYAGLQWFADLIVKHKVAPPPEIDSALAGGGDPFATGAVAMAPGAAYAMSTYRQIKDFEWDVCLNPKGPNGSFSVITTDSLSIYRGTKYPEMAWAFIQACLTEDAAKLYCQEFKGPIPALKAGQKYWLLPGQPPEHQQYLVDAVKNSRPPMQSPFSAPVTLPFQKAIAAAFNGSKTLDEVMAETCPAIAEALQEEVDRVKSYSG